MKSIRKKQAIVSILIGFTLSGCSWLFERDAEGFSTRCSNPANYQDDVLLPPMDVPANLDMPAAPPGTEIPGVEPGVVSASDGCLELPPRIAAPGPPTSEATPEG